jgi:hypothetical protein
VRQGRSGIREDSSCCVCAQDARRGVRDGEHGLGELIGCSECGVDGEEFLLGLELKLNGKGKDREETALRGVRYIC